MSFLYTLEDDLRLWLPDGPVDDETFDKYTTASQSVEDFTRLIITPEEFCDQLDDCGVDVDDYLDTISYNLNH